MYIEKAETFEQYQEDFGKWYARIDLIILLNKLKVCFNGIEVTPSHFALRELKLHQTI
jgi:hypothetical protein